MRSTEPPFSYVRTSNIPRVSSGEMTSYSIGRVECSPSTCSAASRSTPKPTHIFHWGRRSSVQRTSMKVAKASFSQMPSHHSIVTRSPNHMWAISWATTVATRCFSASDALFGSTSNADSR